MMPSDTAGWDCHAHVFEGGRGRLRGVVVLDPDVSAAQLEAMQSRGVRGVRFNLVSPVGNGCGAFDRLAPRLQDLGWPVQWYVAPTQLETIAELHEKAALPAVLDHVAGMTPAFARQARVWRDLQRLADLGAWIKLSGWYRLDSSAPYSDLDPALVRVAARFGARCVWGSDWPHTKFLEPGCTRPAPGYLDTWQPVHRALGAVLADRVLNHHAAALYG